MTDRASLLRVLLPPPSAPLHTAKVVCSAFKKHLVCIRLRKAVTYGNWKLTCFPILTLNLTYYKLESLSLASLRSKFYNTKLSPTHSQAANWSFHAQQGKLRAPITALPALCLYSCLCAWLGEGSNFLFCGLGHW